MSRKDGHRNTEIARKIADKLLLHLGDLIIGDMIISTARSRIDRTGLDVELFREWLGGNVLSNTNRAPSVRRGDGRLQEIVEEVRVKIGDFSRRMGKASKIFYSGHIREDIRLAIYKVLLVETLAIVNGEPLHLDSFPSSLFLHGSMKEFAKVHTEEGGEKYHHGVDLAFFFRFPKPSSRNTRISRSKKKEKGRGSVIVPLNIIGKMDLEDLGDLRFNELVDMKVKYLEDNRAELRMICGDRVDKVLLALKNIKRFTRIALMNAELNSGACEFQTGKGVVYGNIVCSVLVPVLGELYDFYSMVVCDKELSELTVYDWIEALLLLSLPVNMYFYVSGKSPRPRGGLPGVDEVMVEVMVGVDRRLREIAESVGRIMGVFNSGLLASIQRLMAKRAFDGMPSDTVFGADVDYH